MNIYVNSLLQKASGSFLIPLFLNPDAAAEYNFSR